MLTDSLLNVDYYAIFHYSGLCLVSTDHNAGHHRRRELFLAAAKNTNQINHSNPKNNDSDFRLCTKSIYQLQHGCQVILLQGKLPHFDVLRSTKRLQA